MTGTVNEVIQHSGLSVFVVEGDLSVEVEKRLLASPAVSQVTPFGSALHVVGPDARALKSAIDAATAGLTVSVRKGETSLEDVVIQLMTTSRDNMA